MLYGYLKYNTYSFKEIKPCSWCLRHQSIFIMFRIYDQSILRWDGFLEVSEHASLCQENESGETEELIQSELSSAHIKECPFFHNIQFASYQHWDRLPELVLCKDKIICESHCVTNVSSEYCQFRVTERCRQTDRNLPSIGSLSESAGGNGQRQSSTPATQSGSPALVVKTQVFRPSLSSALSQGVKPGMGSRAGTRF